MLGKVENLRGPDPQLGGSGPLDSHDYWLYLVEKMNSPGEPLGVFSHLLLGSFVLLNFNSGGG